MRRICRARLRIAQAIDDQKHHAHEDGRVCDVEGREGAQKQWEECVEGSAGGVDGLARGTSEALVRELCLKCTGLVVADMMKKCVPAQDISSAPMGAPPV